MERFLERRRRENVAPRLLALFPGLQALRIRLSEHRDDGSLVEPAYTRLIVVANAPAVFVFPCQDSACVDGGHDVTVAICAALRRGQADFVGEDRCRGYLGGQECSRVLRYAAAAFYGDQGETQLSRSR
jgi:hypothetical protein